ncbi:Transposase and inactivated derivatives [Propionibacterium australiense]|uniref:Uncharacterized protein n=2 Tax=Propionibacterium australiense TaxID=119981 RepID=A0A383S9R0_9ACTN|nr:hypothetical protein [Propionibacterium australiense]SYZ34657.1 Hypothetical protein PROPAUS_2696 [Propionibacterium australiense]VEH88968.1 Transposase and inactivated derivatives [Propionibacterium australiense]
MQVEVTPEETAVLIRWKKRTDNYMLVRMKAEAILYASEGVGLGIIAKMVERSEKTVREWLSGWQSSRMCSVLTGHAGNQNAAKLTRTQKEDLKTVLAQPPSRSGIDAEFWDVPALRDVVKILFDVEYESESSYQLLLRFCGLSFKLPDPFDKHRDEQAITRRMAEVKAQVNQLLEAGCQVYAVDEVRLEHEAETRRMWLPRGQRTKLYVDRQKVSQSFFGALSLTNKKMRLYPIEGNQNTDRSLSPWNGCSVKPGPRRSRSCWTTPGSTTPKPSPACMSRASYWNASPRSSCRLMRPTTTRSNTSGTPPKPISRTFSEKPRTKLSELSLHTSPDAPSTTTSNTSPNPNQKPILFHDGHIQMGLH